MKRVCVLCQRSPAKKATCCGMLLCKPHEEADAADHDCPLARELLLMKPTPKSRSTPEGALKLEVANLLEDVGMLYMRVNSGSSTFRMRGAPKGWPDFLAFPDDGDAAIETKATHRDDCPWPDCGCIAQRKFRARWERAGRLYILARTLDDVYVGLKLVPPPRQIELPKTRSAR